MKSIFYSKTCIVIFFLSIGIIATLLMNYSSNPDAIADVKKENKEKKLNSDITKFKPELKFKSLGEKYNLKDRNTLYDMQFNSEFDGWFKKYLGKDSITDLKTRENGAAN